MPDYSDRAFWEERYSTMGSVVFDWYMNYDELAAVFEALLPDMSTPHAVEEFQVLIIGCGNSTLGERLADKGFRNLTLVDFSEACISLMKARSENSYPELRYFTMDACRLPFEDSTYQTVLDKGTVDCVLCGADPELRIKQLLGHVARLLVPGGRFLVVSFAPPDDRLEHFEQPDYGWEVQTHVVGKPSLKALRDETPQDFTPRPYNQETDIDPDALHYLYLMVKTPPSKA